MITSISWDKFKKQNEKNRMTLGRMQCIKIIDVQPGNAYGGAFVTYDDYRIRTRDMASIQDIVDWVCWKEIYVSDWIIKLQDYFVQ